MIRAAVVGYGSAGKYFHCYLVRQAEGLELYAVSTRDAQRRRDAEREQGVRTYAGIDELLQDEKVELVIIATPHHTHKELAIKAMDAGRHVVVDKIMCMNASEAQEMIRASERNGVLLSVFHNRRWDWDYLTVRKAIEDGLLGEPYLFEVAILGYGKPGGWRAQKARSGGILYDWPPHLVDQALQIVPCPVASVFCQIQYRKWPVDIGSYAKMLITFQNGVLYQVEISNLAAASKPRWYVLGEEGALVKHGLDPQEGAMRRGDIDAAEEDPQQHARVYKVVDGRRQERVLEPVRGSWKSYYQNISDVLNKGAELIVKPRQIYEVMRVFDAASRSAQTGQAVRL